MRARLLPAAALLLLALPALLPGKPPPPCDGCGQPITGDHLLVKEKHHYHPQHFLCHRCQRPLAGGEFFWREEAPWCRGCYEAAVLPRCDVCGELIHDVFATDGWGNRFHSRHEEEFPRCGGCDRLVCDPLTRGGVTYPDGRAACSLCRATAVETPERVAALVPRAREFLASVGVRFEEGTPPVRLVTREAFEGKGGDSVMTSGRTVASVETLVAPSGARTETRRVEELQLLSGMPEMEFLFVLVHELVHARLHLLASTPMERQAEEALATLASWLWARDRDDPLARHLMAELEGRTDSYGRAFRDARRRLDRMTFREMVERVAREGRLP